MVTFTAPTISFFDLAKLAMQMEMMYLLVFYSVSKHKVIECCLIKILSAIVGIPYLINSLGNFYIPIALNNWETSAL